VLFFFLSLYRESPERVSGDFIRRAFDEARDYEPEEKGVALGDYIPDWIQWYYADWIRVYATTGFDAVQASAVFAMRYDHAELAIGVIGASAKKRAKDQDDRLAEMKKK
jgi:hypothetical protein